MASDEPRRAIGVIERQIAITTGVSRSTASISGAPQLSASPGRCRRDRDDAELERRLFTLPTFEEKPARPLPDWPYVHKELKRRAVTLLLLWEDADGYGYSRFCDLYRGWCKTISATMWQTHGPLRSCSSTSLATPCRYSTPPQRWIGAPTSSCWERPTTPMRRAHGVARSWALHQRSVTTPRRPYVTNSSRAEEPWWPQGSFYHVGLHPVWMTRA